MMENTEQTTYAEETLEELEPQRRRVWLIGGLVLVVLLGAAAFLAGRLMNGPATAGGEAGFGGGNRLVMSGGPAGQPAKSIDLKVTPAPELPTLRPDVNGLFVERKDNSLFVGTGKVTVAIKAGGGETEAKPEASYDGSLVEVVITQDTQIYHDVTEMDLDDLEANAGVVQQKIEPATIEDIASQSSISAWGRKVGDRLIADVIVFQQAFRVKR
jgi:hypothetical protein